MNSQSASAFIEQIKTEYRAVVEAEKSALPHAIKCGEFLKLAKENLKAERGGNWSDWLGINCPEIAQETASLYMRLAEHKAKVGKAKSIREARKLLPTAKRRGGNRKEGPEISNGVTNSPDPAVVLQATDANEIIANIQDDSEKLEEVAKASIAKLTPDKVCDALTQAWDVEQLRDLAKRLSAHLNTLGPSTSRDLGIPNMLRRPLETAKPS
jgi:hypothetical protein